MLLELVHIKSMLCVLKKKKLVKCGAIEQPHTRFIRDTHPLGSKLLLIINRISNIKSVLCVETGKCGAQLYSYK